MRCTIELELLQEEPTLEVRCSIDAELAAVLRKQQLSLVERKAQCLRYLPPEERELIFERFDAGYGIRITLIEPAF